MVSRWRYVEGIDFFKPDPGTRFIGVDVTLVNLSTSDKSVSTLLSMWLKGPESRKYTIDFGATAALGVSGPDGGLAPGERLRGSLGFMVPEMHSRLQFVFEPSLFGSDRVIIDLGEVPSNMPIPAAIAGERPQPKAKIGESKTVDGVAVVVHGARVSGGGEFVAPDPGNIYVIVDLSLTNTKQQPEIISTLLQMWVKDPTGQRYTISLFARVGSTSASPDGTLEPGETVRGEVGFEVPLGSRLVFVYSSLFSGKLFFELP